MVAPGECYKTEDKRKYTEPEMERMSGDLTDSDDVNNDSDIMHWKTHFVFPNVKFLRFFA